MSGAPSDQFPRSKALPSQSPLFWVEQKDRYLRQLLIRDIEECTGRRLIVYFGNRFENAQIDAKDPSYVAELLGDVGSEPFDLLLETSGGVTDSTEALVSLIRNSMRDFRVIVARSAKSNGTLLCLAAKAIVMGPVSELGPIDPHLNSIPATILSQPQFAAVNIVLHHQGIYALNQTKKLAQTLLKEGMCSDKSEQEITELVEKLSTRNVYFSHGSVIDHHEAEALGLKVHYLEPENELWKRIWLLYCMYDYDCRRSGFLKIFEGRRTSTAIAVPPSPHVPHAKS